MKEKSKQVAYLACPYSHPDPQIRKFRCTTVNKVAYELFREGILVYSPLTHNIPIDQLGFHGDHLTWMEFDFEMLSRCDFLIVLKMNGWEASKGVAAEIEKAKKLGLPIEWREIDEKSTSPSCVSPFNQLLQKMLTFYTERDWSQFHSPKNLAMNLGVEVGEVMEHFRWLTESKSFINCPQKLKELKDELGDVFLVLVHLSHLLEINLLEAAEEKLDKIGKKYPVEQCKGRSEKYTEYQTN